MQNVQGKVAFVTGGASGIGLGIAGAFVAGRHEGRARRPATGSHRRGDGGLRSARSGAERACHPAGRDGPQGHGGRGRRDRARLRQRARARQQRRRRHPGPLQGHHLRGLGLRDGRESRRRDQRTADLPATHARAWRGWSRGQHRVTRGTGPDARAVRDLCRGQGRRGDDLGEHSRRTAAGKHRRDGAVPRSHPHQHRRARQESPAAVRRRRCVPGGRGSGRHESAVPEHDGACRGRPPGAGRHTATTSCTSSPTASGARWRKRAMRHSWRRRRPGSIRRSSRCCRRGRPLAPIDADRPSRPSHARAQETQPC